jgi:hypothetical protein
MGVDPKTVIKLAAFAASQLGLVEDTLAYIQRDLEALKDSKLHSGLLLMHQGLSSTDDENKRTFFHNAINQLAEADSLESGHGLCMARYALAISTFMLGEEDLAKKHLHKALLSPTELNSRTRSRKGLDIAYKYTLGMGENSSLSSQERKIEQRRLLSLKLEVLEAWSGLSKQALAHRLYISIDAPTKYFKLFDGEREVREHLFEIARVVRKRSIPVSYLEDDGVKIARIELYPFERARLTT